MAETIDLCDKKNEKMFMQMNYGDLQGFVVIAFAQRPYLLRHMASLDFRRIMSDMNTVKKDEKKTTQGVFRCMCAMIGMPDPFSVNRVRSRPSVRRNLK